MTETDRVLVCNETALRELVSKIMTSGVEYRPSSRHIIGAPRSSAGVRGYDPHGTVGITDEEEDLLRLCLALDEPALVGDMRDHDRHFLWSCIDRAYRKTKGTKAEQVDAIVAAVLDAVDKMKMYSPRVPIDDDGPDWIVHLDCGHTERLPIDHIRDFGIWPYCEECCEIVGIKSARPLP